MRKIIGVLVMVLAFAAPQSFAVGQGQVGTIGDQTRSGRQSSEDSERRLPVQNHKGQEVGQVVAMVTTDNIVAYYLVAMNGSEGELTPVPFSAAQYDSQKNTVILLNVRNSELLMAPTISPDEVQKLADPEFERQVHSYYEQQPEQQ